MTTATGATGKVTRIAGPVVGARGLDGVRLYNVVRVGQLGLVGEVIRLTGDVATIQVYEDTSGIRVGEPVVDSGTPLMAHLGPGLLGSVYDGLQRPLEGLASVTGDFIRRGADLAPLAPERRWQFTPVARVGTMVRAGDTLGLVAESPTVQQHIMVPPGEGGRLVEIGDGAFRVGDVVARLEAGDNHGTPHREITLGQRWPVRKPRPYQGQLDPCEPLVTGTRIIDALFPVAKGGSAIIPGGFGTGKTVAEHSLARWADADIVVYVGCGERGNEMTDVLEEFPKLEDPRTGRPLMERTVLIANTSNMPVAAREASIYTGITIAEYYRDMGYDVLLLADSTSRWGEALREISGRLEEMPGEEGYPAYLAARLAEFYERSGRVDCLGSPQKPRNDPRTGSVTIVGAVSPPGGDFSEPMTQNSMRVAGTFWALDYDLSRRRHFPSINWTRSYSLYDFSQWYTEQVAEDWIELMQGAMSVLQQEVELLEIVQLVGSDALAEAERALLAVARMLREDFLQQSAFHEIDRFSTLEKAYWMVKAIMTFHEQTQAALTAGVSLEQIVTLPVVEEIARMREMEVAQAQERIAAIVDQIHNGFEELGVI